MTAGVGTAGAPRQTPWRGRQSQAALWSLSLDDLEAFMKVARMGLMTPLKEGDYDGLVKMMGHLMKVKERQMATDTMFDPLKQTIELLKTYGEEMPEETHLKLQVPAPACHVLAGGDGATGAWGIPSREPWRWLEEKAVLTGDKGGGLPSGHGSRCMARWNGEVGRQGGTARWPQR